MNVEGGVGPYTAMLGVLPPLADSLLYELLEMRPVRDVAILFRMPTEKVLTLIELDCPWWYAGEAPDVGTVAFFRVDPQTGHPSSAIICVVREGGLTEDHARERIGDLGFPYRVVLQG